ncbi:MAG: hypothetical protein M3R61_17395 [Chloroflexota bacterium]|nr:hypothetical protein [Chloroflexota bacterium]
MLFDIMPVHNRENDDLEYLLRDALWSSQNIAPECGAYIRHAARALWLNDRPCARHSCWHGQVSASGLVLVFGTAVAGAMFYIITLEGGAIAQLDSSSLSSALRCLALGTLLEQMLMKGACFI